MNRDELHLADTMSHVLEAEEIAGQVGYDGFLRNGMAQLALTHLAQVIGEAARKVSGAGREALPDVPWRDIVGMRHIIVHDYLRVDLDIIWVTVTEKLPELRRSLASAVPERRIQDKDGPDW